jgi:hypothetical protein
MILDDIRMLRTKASISPRVPKKTTVPPSTDTYIQVLQEIDLELQGKGDSVSIAVPLDRTHLGHHTYGVGQR